MQLKDQHKLNVEDTVAKYIPDFPQGNGIQLKHLLTHTSEFQSMSREQRIFLMKN